MGNSHSDIQNQELFKQFKRQQWNRLKDLGFYQLWQNNKTGQLCEAYKLDYVPQQQQLEHYRFRHYNQNADNFVQIRYVDVQKNPSLCNHGQSYVLTEFIPVKLHQMDNLTHLQGYSLLRASYRAFHTMEAFHGPFIPDENLIGVNLNGKPKIWLNKNHCQNKAQKTISAQIWQKHLGQVSQNVKRIIQMVQQKLTTRKFPSQFRQYFYNNIMNFAQAAQFVDDYCEMHRIPIPTTINYLKYVQDSDIIQTINKYQSRRNLELSQRLNTLDSYQNNQKIENYERQNNHFPIKKTFSHVNLTNVHPNNFIYRHSEQSHIVQHNDHPNAINFTVYPRNQIKSPVIQRVNTSPTLNASTFGPVIIKQNVRPSTVYQPLRPIINVIPQMPVMNMNPRSPTNLVYQNNSRIQNLNSKSNVIETIPLHQTKFIPKKSVVALQNMKTPQHIANNATFVPPSKITSFEQATRKLQVIDNKIENKVVENQQVMQTKNQNEIDHNQQKVNQHKKSQYWQESDNQSSQSIHQKILQFQNQELNSKSQAQDKMHQEQLQNYITMSNNPHIDFRIAQSHDVQIQSEPDWQGLANRNRKQQHYSQPNQQEYQTHQAMNHVQNDQHIYKQTVEQQYHTNSSGQLGLYQDRQHKNQISPIKSSTNNQEHFANDHYAMFSKYAKGNHATQNSDHINVPQNFNMGESFNPHHMQFNQGGQISSGQQQQQHFYQQPQNNDSKWNTQVYGKNALQTPDLQSSQRMRNIQSKNTSINRGHVGGQSCGTLVIHESRQNIYQGINHEQKPAKVLINNIRQQSHESEPQDQYYDNQRVLSVNDHEQQQYDHNNVEKQQQHQQYQPNSQQYEQYQLQRQQYERQREQYERQKQQYEKEKQQQYERQRQEYERQRQQYERRQYQNQENVNQSGQNNHQINYSQNQRSQHHLNLNQYQNLHFRNQSNQLYQYTPVQSVYKNEHIHNHQNPSQYNFMRPNYQDNNGVQQIVQLQRHQDIQEYIKNKYSNIIGQPQVIHKNEPPNSNQYRAHKEHNAHRAMTFAKPINEYQTSHADMSINKHNILNQSGFNQEQSLQRKINKIQKIQSKCYQIDQRDTPQVNKNTSNRPSGLDDMDFLDVRNLQKSLDQKYKKSSQQRDQYPIHMSPKVTSPKNQIKHSQTMSQDDGMNVAALQKKLLKFEQRQSIQRQKSQRKLQTLNDESVHKKQQLNFHELDNIVQLMDKKIQQSQKKQQLSSTSRKQKQVSQFEQTVKDPLGQVQLQVSISNKQMTLNNMPILRQQHISNASNSNPASYRQSYYKFGIDSEDFATGRDKYGFASSLRIQGTDNQARINNYTKTYQQKYKLSPVIELDRKYENYSSKNYSTLNDNYTVDLNSDYTSQYRRKSSRRSTRNNSDVKRLTDQIANKYDKYVNKKQNQYNFSNYQSQNPFSKKKNYDSYEHDSSKNQSTKYMPTQSNISKKSNLVMERKRSSYLNTITQLQGEYNPSPYKEQDQKKITVVSPLNYESGQQNYLNLSNRNSNNGSKTDVGLKEANGKKSSTKITYDQLRDLLWK